MTLQATVKHLTRLTTRLESVTIPKAERRALTEAIAWLAGERRREIRADLRGKVIDCIDGNHSNLDISNFRVTTMPENRRNR